MTDNINASLETAAKGTAILIFGTVASNILWFAIKLIIIKTSTAEQLGTYSLAVAIISVITLVASLGVHEGATKYVSSLLGKGKKTEASAAGKFSLKTGMLSGTAACTALFLFSGTLSRHLFYKPELENPLRILSISIPFTVLSWICVWILRGHGVMRAKVYYLDIGIPLFFLIFLALSFTLSFSFNNILYAFSLSSIAVFASAGIYGYKKIKLNVLSIKGAVRYDGFVNFSLAALFLGLMLVLFGWTDTLVLGRYTSLKAVGIYNIGVLLANLLLFPFIAVGFVFMPMAGEMFAQGRLPELGRTFQILTKWIFSATLPIFFVLFFFPEMVIAFLFGVRFLGAVLPLRILSAGFLFQTALGPGISMLMAMGHSRHIRNISIMGTFLNISLNYLMVKRLGLGLAGAATATMLSYSSISIMNCLVLYRISGFHSVTTRYIRPIVWSAVIGSAIYAVAKILPLNFWMLPFYLFFFIGGYFVMLLLSGGFDAEDIILLCRLSEKVGIKSDRIWKIACQFNKHLVPERDE